MTNNPPSVSRHWCSGISKDMLEGTWRHKYNMGRTGNCLYTQAWHQSYQCTRIHHNRGPSRLNSKKRLINLIAIQKHDDYNIWKRTKTHNNTS